MIASELDVPILPVTIDGAFEVLPRGTYLPHPRRVVLTVSPRFSYERAGHSAGTYPGLSTPRTADHRLGSAR